jgi:DNA-binding MarR family transcriptional regulator
MNLFRSVAEIAEAIGRDSTMTLALVFTRVANAGSEGLLQATVQRELDISPAVLTRAVQALVSLGLISRSIDNADGRHHILRITGKGSAVLRAEPPSPVCCYVRETRNSFAHSAP